MRDALREAARRAQLLIERIDAFSSTITIFDDPSASAPPAPAAPADAPLAPAPAWQCTCVPPHWRQASHESGSLVGHMQTVSARRARSLRVAAETACVGADELMRQLEEEEKDEACKDKNKETFRALQDELLRLDESVGDLEAVVAWTATWTLEPLNVEKQVEQALRATPIRAPPFARVRA